MIGNLVVDRHTASLMDVATTTFVMPNLAKADLMSLERAERTWRCGSRTMTRSPACGRPAATSLSIAWSWPATSVVPCFPAKRFTTSTTTATTTGWRTCNCESAGTGLATSFGVWTAVRIGWALYPWPRESRVVA